MQSEERREAEDTHPDEPSGDGGEIPTESSEPERDDVPDTPAESKRAEDPEDRAPEATDDGMSKRTQTGP